MSSNNSRYGFSPTIDQYCLEGGVRMTGRLHFRELRAQTDSVIGNMKSLIAFCIENTNAGILEKQPTQHSLITHSTNACPSIQGKVTARRNLIERLK